MSQRSTSGAGREAADARRAVPASTLRGLRLLEPDKPALYASPPRRAKRTHTATQMKRVQRANGSLAQVWGRAAPNGLPAENAAKPIWSRKNALPPRRRLRSPFPPFSAFPRPFVLRRDRHKETRKPEVNQQSPITTRHLRTHEWRSRPTAEQERNIPQAVLFGAMRQTAGVIERKTFREKRMTGAERTQDIWIEPHARHSERNAWQA